MPPAEDSLLPSGLPIIDEEHSLRLRNGGRFVVFHVTASLLHARQKWAVGLATWLG